ncbi:hypothetical protein C8R41DRAFT_917673 [Lentinula lateritia]|uniref:Uncharacterized protein n=1 Tax=Lentinula lateritia TaxID=40482 RepID=A0ABQ8VLT1_9AGAR|nr:hypothetical protein C8R41DRAFT_917673 [Lentinula lateritia]
MLNRDYVMQEAVRNEIDARKKANSVAFQPPAPVPKPSPLGSNTASNPRLPTVYLPSNQTRTQQTPNIRSRHVVHNSFSEVPSVVYYPLQNPSSERHYAHAQHSSNQLVAPTTQFLLNSSYTQYTSEMHYGHALNSSNQFLAPMVQSPLNPSYTHYHTALSNTSVSSNLEACPSSPHHSSDSLGIWHSSKP